MKKVVLLGAGFVTRPLVHYLSEKGFEIIIATRTVSKGHKLLEGSRKGDVIKVDATDENDLERPVKVGDIIISLLPYTFHVSVARLCLKHRKDMITTSYVKEAMAELHEEARKEGLIFLNEVGLDPGIDHMSAMRIIDRIHGKGGKVLSFKSYCGGLPAPEANTNPFGYKFSWSPRGVIMAGMNSARYLLNGREVYIPSENLFADMHTIDIEGLGTFESYPNRDSIPYIEKYGINEVKTMYRGTLRNIGWCSTWKKIVELGILKQEERDNLDTLTWAEYVATLIPGENGINLKKNISKFLGIGEDSDIMNRLEWVGLLSNEKIPLKKGNGIDLLTELLMDKLKYEKGERDMVVLEHRFIADYPDHREEITSSLIDFGIPDGDTSMARTVSLPAAIAARLILEGKIESKGVLIPVIPEIYKPILDELEELNIVCKETIRSL